MSEALWAQQVHTIQQNPVRQGLHFLTNCWGHRNLVKQGNDFELKFVVLCELETVLQPLQHQCNDSIQDTYVAYVASIKFQM